MAQLNSPKLGHALMRGCSAERSPLGAASLENSARGRGASDRRNRAAVEEHVLCGGIGREDLGEVRVREMRRVSSHVLPHELIVFVMAVDDQ